MSFEYDLPGATTATVLTPSTSISANTNSAILDLSPYQGALSLFLNAGAATAGSTPVLQAAIYDSADNSTFAAVAGATFTNVTNAANSGQEFDLDTRSYRRYMKVVMTVSGANAAFPVGLVALGSLEYTPNAV